MIRRLIYIFRKKVQKFIRDEFGGNLIEYALLIGFALFVFFILVGVITSILNWTLGLSNDFFDIIGGLGG
jgi:Flp pilus assembly pilin Flp